MIRHQPIAEGLRAVPGQWAEVGNYRWHTAAKSAIHCIHNGSLPSYQPAGSFEAEARFDADGDAHAWARYVGTAKVAA
ncbi:hypothetical protein [Kitasatospora griseola]|uniref:hypothetical protein n=1 Tax=Kitasatospora griseola TaxID=2064 RepID=UPI0036626BBB